MLPPLPVNRKRLLFTLLTLAVLAVTAAIYVPGLHGPFVLDDVSNLEPLKGWIAGWYGWSHVVFGNRSGLLGRPLSMVTFLLDAAVEPSLKSFAFKLTNLGVHLACGAAMLWLAWQVFRRWNATRPVAPWAALILATWWLWLPLNVETVLYVVQRMAQLAALFMLLALGCFMAARERIAQGKASGQWLLWIGVPALTLLAAFSKENGLLALPLALVLEAFLPAPGEQHRPRSVNWFFVLTVGLPVLAAIAYVIWRPGFILGGYAQRHFSLTERLLTEPRVLWSYVQTMLVPVGPRMGFFQDNFPVSSSLVQPWTTLPAIAAWIAAVVLGWRWRKGNPLFLVGVVFYLVGQAMESSVIPLLIYFAHRNYLPSFGILLAVTGTLVWGWQMLPTPTINRRQAAAALLGGVLALYAASTWGHVQDWRNNRTFYPAQVAYNPTSPRLQRTMASLAVQAGDLRAALHHIDISDRHGTPAQHVTATLWRMNAYCASKKSPPRALYRQLAERAHGQVTLLDMKIFELFATHVHEGDCPDVNTAAIVKIVGPWLASTPDSPQSEHVWRSRYNLGRIAVAGGHLVQARKIVQRAWHDSRYNNVVGVLLFRINYSLHDLAACHAILTRLEHSPGHDPRLDKVLTAFRNGLAKADADLNPAPLGR